MIYIVLNHFHILHCYILRRDCRRLPHKLASPFPRYATLLLPQPLQLPQHNHVRIQKPVDALSHAGLLVFVQFAILDVAARYAFAEAGIGEGVYC
jgi:hypothetical protein